MLKTNVKIATVVSLALFLGTLSSPVWAKKKKRNSSGENKPVASTTANTQVANANELIFTVGNMHCESCEQNITSSLLEGGNFSKEEIIQVSKKHECVRLLPTASHKVDKDAVIKIIADAGYTASFPGKCLP